MSPEEYLKTKLETCAQTELRPVDREFLESQGIEKFIYRILTSKKFRKWKIVDEYANEMKRSITHIVTKKEPLELAWFFGGYKLWRFPSSPLVDWAELFTILYLIEYVSNIVSVYEPGAKIIFWAAHPSVMKYQSNIPEQDCRAYHESFNKLLDTLRSYFPRNLIIELKSFEVLYSNKSEYLSELNQMITEVEDEYNNKWTTERKEMKKMSSNLNIQWQGAENWEKIPQKEKEEKIRLGPIVHDGYCRLSKVREVIRGVGKIALTATPIPSGSLTVGTSSSSVTKFWTGFGVIEKRGDSYVERILSPQQLESVKDKPHDVLQSKLIPLKNFEEIWVFPEELDFTSIK
ncbi:hypothetical protein KKA01_04245 [Patescibacteria group bacterium]|nr:hypothetical protein [Patescibacteria group bacterium]